MSQVWDGMLSKEDQKSTSWDQKKHYLQLLIFLYNFYTTKLNELVIWHASNNSGKQKKNVDRTKCNDVSNTCSIEKRRRIVYILGSYGCQNDFSMVIIEGKDRTNAKAYDKC